jgi:uncharacterized protein (DUF1015 family)
MATIRPFIGLRFDAAAGSLADIVAPPYDVISPQEREALAAKNQYSVVRLTLPEQEKDDRSKYVKYARSASRLEEWRRSKVINPEEKPALYRYNQVYQVPGTNQTLSRTTLVALIKVEPYEYGVVLPHEQTFPKHKEDRLRILEATRSHLECIFGLYEDDDQALHTAVTSAPSTLLAELVTSEDEIRHTFEKIDDEQVVQQIVQGMAEKKVWIADGHHRYETALNFRSQLGEQDREVAEDYMMMALCSISDPGLVLLPTHRILKHMAISSSDFKAKLAEFFEIQDCPNGDLMATIHSKGQEGSTAFGVALPGGQGFVAATSDPGKAAALGAGTGSELLQKLDVSLLHNLIFAKGLGLTGHDFFGYTRIEQEALDAVENGAPAAILMNPPTVDDMRFIALGGEKMPQKSTYYYPKLLSGLVMWSLKDHQR